MTIKERLEDFEYTYLSDFAQKSKETKGRLRKIEDHPLRTNFQRDRDRIIHSKSFRRLKHKTQVFLAPFDDHFRTRLTHTLEVSQIARTLARALRLNEDLTEAIALGHDWGHTPFGHCGEGSLGVGKSRKTRHHGSKRSRRTPFGGSREQGLWSFERPFVLVWETEKGIQGRQERICPRASRGFRRPLSGFLSQPRFRGTQGNL